MSSYPQFIQQFAKSRKSKSGRSLLKAAAKAWRKSGQKKQSLRKHKNVRRSCPKGSRKQHLKRKDGSKSKRSKCVSK